MQRSVGPKRKKKTEKQKAKDARNRCVGCGRLIPEERIFCDSCAYHGDAIRPVEVEDTKVCKECSRQIENDAELCDECIMVNMD